MCSQECFVLSVRINIFSINLFKNFNKKMVKHNKSQKKYLLIYCCQYGTNYRYAEWQICNWESHFLHTIFPVSKLCVHKKKIAVHRPRYSLVNKKYSKLLEEVLKLSWEITCRDAKRVALKVKFISDFSSYEDFHSLLKFSI